MSRRTDLDDLPARIRRLVPDFKLALTRLRDRIDCLDGFPTSTIGASDPTAFPPAIHHGQCHELVHRLMGEGMKVVRCGLERPCPEHDTHVPLTTVEAAAGQLAPLLHHRNRLLDALDAVLAAVAHAERETRRHLTQDDKPSARDHLCNRGTGRDGVLVWGDPLCENVRAGDRGPLCLACAKREQRWRKANNLPARENEAA